MILLLGMIFLTSALRDTGTDCCCSSAVGPVADTAAVASTAPIDDTAAVTATVTAFAAAVVVLLFLKHYCYYIGYKRSEILFIIT